MSAFNIPQLACDMEEIQMAFTVGHKITPDEREIMKLQFADLRRFFGMCLLRKDEVEAALDWQKK